MSVAYECEKGDYIYNIIECWLANNEAIDSNNDDEPRKLVVGEKLEVIEVYFDENNALQPYAWGVKFLCEDGFIGSGAQFNFVTEEEWNSLKDYFKQQFTKEQLPNI